MASTTVDPTTPAGGSDFRTTYWSVVLLAGESQAPRADAALENLCRTYWNPFTPTFDAKATARTTRRI